ncbi:MAG: amino acid transporter [Nocardioidaceae bacterium]|nr:amino acid transporter [Nocardioidaceae bacterium]
MLLTSVVQVLDALDGADVRSWVAGGWGVDALVGRQTREHRDLDLAIDLADLDASLQVLRTLEYVVETDWLPVRVELWAQDDEWVDLHPVRFDAAGHGLQGKLDGTHFRYPPTAFTDGHLERRLVRCLSVDQQLRFHSGYEPREQDKHDIDTLKQLKSRT